MKIVVPIKRVVDYNVKVRPLGDQSDVDLNNVKMAMNPFCMMNFLMHLGGMKQWQGDYMK